jgi:hypothetical protein
MVTSPNATDEGDSPTPLWGTKEYYTQQREEYRRTRDLYFPRRGFERLPMFLQVILGFAGAAVLASVAILMLSALAVGLPIVLRGD